MYEQATSAVLRADDRLRMPDGDGYEFLDGRPVEKTMGAKADKVAVRLGGWLDQFCSAHRLGHVFGSSTGYRCFPGQADRVRKPDASVVLLGRFPDEEVPAGDVTIPPDLAVEVVSPNDLYGAVEAKVAEYRSARVRLIWVLDPDARTVLVRRLDGTAAEVGADGDLSGEDVVPGFRCRVADLFT